MESFYHERCILRSGKLSNLSDDVTNIVVRKYVFSQYCCQILAVATLESYPGYFLSINNITVTWVAEKS